jgi:hypothetical protein
VPANVEIPGWQLSSLVVTCGRLAGHSFVPLPQTGCLLEASVTSFRAPSALGPRILAIGACAGQPTDAVAAGEPFYSNRVCGTWYANVDIRE